MMTIGTVDGNGCYNYTGVCLDYLQMTAMRYGIPTTSGSVVVKNNPRANDPDGLVNLFTSTPLVSSECEHDGLPLLCNYGYLVCDSSGNSSVVLSDLEEECIEVSQGSCRSIWQTAVNLNIVPNCNNLDANVPLTLPSSNITCHPQFKEQCGLCVPLCEEFSETPESIQETIDVFFIIAACLMIIGSILVLIVSVIRRKVM